MRDQRILGRQEDGAREMRRGVVWGDDILTLMDGVLTICQQFLFSGCLDALSVQS